MGAPLRKSEGIPLPLKPQKTARLPGDVLEHPDFSSIRKYLDLADEVLGRKPHRINRRKSKAAGAT